MTWIKIDDRMPEHPKIAGLRDRAFRAHVEALCYCAGSLTDGFIPEAVAKRRRWIPSSAELVGARLWESAEGGWRIHDYLEHQRSRERAEGVSVQRAAAGSRGGKVRASHQANPKQVATTLLEANPSRSDQIREDQIRSEDERESPLPPLRVEFWNRGCKLRGLLSLSPQDDTLIDGWIAQGVTLEDWEAVDAGIAEWAPDHPWAAFKSAMGDRVARGARPVVPHPIRSGPRLTGYNVPPDPVTGLRPGEVVLSFEESVLEMEFQAKKRALKTRAAGV